jgi:hypothetical protein
MDVVFGAVVLFAAIAVIFAALAFIKLVVRLILLPLLLIKFIVGAILTLIVGPVLFVVGLILAAVLALVLFVPLLPFVIAAGLIWLLVRASRRPAVA